MAGNRLADSTSPYLLQHKDNPVHWQPWDKAALAEAEAADKPILLSIGYAACHWCHVMAHESFEDEATAALMNSLYVNIKVDREERPDIDALYMSALQLLGQQGGWPLTMFLTPKGEPFWGGTYFPPERRYGQPAFREVLEAVHRAYRSEPKAIAQNRDAILEALAGMARSPDALSVEPRLIDEIATRLAGQIDPQHGGIRGQPKFPQTGILELLWRAHRRSGDPALRHAVTVSLDHMCQGGLYDHLAGGFARYSTDERWLVPHFEKMLYDNAAFLEILSLVGAGTGSALYAARTAETAAFVLRDMRAPDGGFAASYDADSEGEEGRYYVWTMPEVVSLLGRDAALFCGVYDVTEAGNWEGVTILNRLRSLELLAPDVEARLVAARAVLLEARGRRPPPGFDDKVLSDWNGLMIAALARSGMAYGRRDWIAGAADAFDAVVRHLGYGSESDRRLAHVYRDGAARHEAMADGYANMARAALLLEEATGAPRYLALARAWTQTLDRHYWDASQGGYFYTADDAEALIARSRFAFDNPIPNANGTMIEVQSRLYHRTGEATHRARAQELVEAFSGELARNFFPLATYLNGIDFAFQATQIVICGKPGAPDTTEFLEIAWQSGLPARQIALVGPDDALPEGHPAAGKVIRADRVTAYVCRGTTCSLPLSDPEALRSALSRAF